jgi:hypothetical protein
MGTQCLHFKVSHVFKREGSEDIPDPDPSSVSVHTLGLDGSDVRSCRVERLSVMMMMMG